MIALIESQKHDNRLLACLVDERIYVTTQTPATGCLLA